MIAQKRQPRRRASASRRGTAVAELAVCLPIIVLLVVATIEACTMIYLKQSLSIAAYEGGRTAIVPGATSSDVTAQCQQILDDRNVQGSGVTVTPNNVQAAAVGTFLRVNVSAPCDSNSLIGRWFYSGRTITGSSQFMKEF